MWPGTRHLLSLMHLAQVLFPAVRCFHRALGHPVQCRSLWRYWYSWLGMCRQRIDRLRWFHRHHWSSQVSVRLQYPEVLWHCLRLQRVHPCLAEFLRQSHGCPPRRNPHPPEWSCNRLLRQALAPVEGWCFLHLQSARRRLFDTECHSALRAHHWYSHLSAWHYLYWSLWMYSWSLHLKLNYLYQQS